MPGRKLDALTGIRFFAALHVLLFHVLPWQGYQGTKLIGSGFIGVGFFFTLSGYIYGYTYMGREVQPERFYSKRFWRIYPVYALSLMVALPLFGYLHGWSLIPEYLPTRLTLTQAWFPNQVLEWNTPAWSLSVEAFFYLLVPVLVGPVSRLRDSAAWWLFAICAVLAVIPSIAYEFTMPTADVTTVGLWINIVKFWPPVHLPVFVAGLLLARAGAANLTGLQADCLSVVALALAGLGIWLLPFPVLHTGGLLLPFALLIYAQSSGAGFIGRFLSTPTLVLLGDASYSLYILHQPVFEYFQRLMWRISDVGPEVIGAAFVPVAIALSIASWLIVEKWFLKGADRVPAP